MSQHTHPLRAPSRCTAIGRALPLALAAVLFAAGCATSTTAMRYHSIEPAVAAARPVAYAGPPLQVQSVDVPSALDRAELLREVGPGRYEVREFDHWAAPLPRLARAALSADLAARLPAGLLVFPGAAWPVAGADLSVDIASFETRGGRASMQVSWSLRPRATSGRAASTVAVAAATRGGQLRLQTTDAGDTPQAFSALLGQLADAVAAELARP